MFQISYSDINVWLDVVFSTLYVVVLIGLVVHFGGSMINGRFKKKWILKQWPQHDEPHPPALPKFIHFQHMIMMIVLGFTGMYIRFPFFDGGRTAMRYIHYFAMIVVTANLLWRFWYAFLSKRRDWREFAVTKKDVMSAPGVLLYYSYISNKKPHTAKYNVMQKGSYLFFAVLMIVQAFSGFSLLQDKIIFGFSPRFLLVGWWLGAFVGGTAMAGAWMRLTHYTITWLFIIMTTIHVYLSATEDIPVTLNFFGLGGGDEHHEAPATPHSPEPAEPTMMAESS